jgi:predicted secreted protein
MDVDTVDVKVNQEFRIPRKSIATAGYVWKIESLPDAIQFLGSEIQKPSVETKPGDATTQVFRFRALKAGEYSITFILSRPWENKSIESHEVKVKTN